MAKKQPVIRRIYKYSELVTLDLPDSPSLNIRINGRLHPIQDAHVTAEQLLEKPEFANSFWEYIGTTQEDIPVFNYTGKEQYISDLVDYQIYKSPFGRGEGLWVTPKDFPRPQQ